MDAPDPIDQLRGLLGLMEPVTGCEIAAALQYGEVEVITDTTERRVWSYPGGCVGLHRPSGTILIEPRNSEPQATKPGRTSEAIWTADA